MDWLARMNCAMDYIEVHLDGEISYDEIARLACSSTYHFQRMFPFITGITLSEYIRRRRLTLAAFDLQATDEKVIEIALKYGYESQSAFTRAFKALHGVMPVAARTSGAPLKAYPRMTFQISVRGNRELQYTIMERPAFTLFGIAGKIGTDKSPFISVPEFCRKCDEDGSVDEMNELLGRFHDTYLHAALYDFGDEGFQYMIAYFLPQGMEIPSKFQKLAVPARTWAVFPMPGPDCTMEEFRRRIWREWFSASGYEQAEGPELEMYYGQAAHQNAICEVWVPVKKQGS